MDEVPRPQAVLLAFDDGDARAGENEEVFLVVELAMVLRTALSRLEHGQVVADLLEPTSVALERADVAHRLAGHPLQVTAVCDERTTHTSSSREEVGDQVGDQLRLAQGQIVVAVDFDEPRAGDAARSRPARTHAGRRARNGRRAPAGLRPSRRPRTARYWPQRTSRDD